MKKLDLSATVLCMSVVTFGVALETTTVIFTL